MTEIQLYAAAEVERIVSLLDQRTAEAVKHLALAWSERADERNKLMMCYLNEIIIGLEDHRKALESVTE